MIKYFYHCMLSLIFAIVFNCAAYAQGGPANVTAGESTAANAELIHENSHNGPAKAYAQAIQAEKGQDSMTTVTYASPYLFPQAGVATIGMPMGGAAAAAFNAAMASFSTTAPVPATASQLMQVATATADIESALESDPQNSMAQAQAQASAVANAATNSMAGAAVSQGLGAIEFSRYYLINFTAMSGSPWTALRNNIFIPMALLLLLPGAVLAQAKSIVAQGSPILGEVSPFEGITRSIVAIFLIPASFLVVNYGIDLANAITYGISYEYWQMFGTDMYQDAECAEMRAFPANGPGENLNALIPGVPNFMPPMFNDAWSMFESFGIANKLFDPCAGLNQSNMPDEQQPATMTADRAMANGGNAFLTMTWNIMCAFQTVFIYYLWLMGPVVAALWVWPMEKLRSALPSWIEGTVTICFWSLFWNVVVLLMACFRGVSETGTLVMTALNGLATISVWYAFDFSELISQGAAYSMQNAMTQAMQKASGGGAGGGGGGGGGGSSGGGRSPGNGFNLPGIVGGGGGGRGGGGVGGGGGGAGGGGTQPAMSMMSPAGFNAAGASTSGAMLAGVANSGIGGPLGGAGAMGAAGTSALTTNAAMQQRSQEMTQMQQARMQSMQQAMTAEAMQRQTQQGDVARQQGEQMARQQQAYTVASYLDNLRNKPDLGANNVNNMLARNPLSDELMNKSMNKLNGNDLNDLNRTLGTTGLPNNALTGAGAFGPPPMVGSTIPTIALTPAGSTPPPETRFASREEQDGAFGIIREIPRTTTTPPTENADFRISNEGSREIGRDSISTTYLPGQSYSNTYVQPGNPVEPQIVQPTPPPQPAPVEQITYVPVTKEVQSQPQIIIQKEQAPPAQPAPAPTPKPTTDPGFFSAPSIVPLPGRSLSDIVSGMQPGTKSNTDQNQTDGGSLTQSVYQRESLAEQLSRLQRGGGRAAASGKDILSDLPPQDSDDQEESEDPKA